MRQEVVLAVPAREPCTGTGTGTGSARGNDPRRSEACEQNWAGRRSAS
jgi:hypothetical protein